MNKSRKAMVVVTAIASVVVLGKSLANSAAKSASVSKFAFPKSIPLSRSQFVSDDAVNPYLVQPPAYISGNFIAGKRYRYLHDEKYLDIEMRYLGNTNGDLKSFITSQTGELFPVLKNSDRGFYTVYADEDKAYLSACINSRGGTTATSDQFNRNRLIYDVRLDRFVPWLSGKAELKDKRCLWAHLSYPLDRNSTEEETYRTLEIVWQDWQAYWRSNFPNK